MNNQIQIHEVSMVKREMKKRRYTPTDIANALRLSTSTVQGLLNRDRLHVSRLLQFSEALEYNFFKEIAWKLPYAEPATEENKLIGEQQNRIKELEMEVHILRQTLKDLIAR